MIKRQNEAIFNSYNAMPSDPVASRCAFSADGAYPNKVHCFIRNTLYVCMTMFCHFILTITLGPVF